MLDSLRAINVLNKIYILRFACISLFDSLFQSRLHLLFWKFMRDGAFILLWLPYLTFNFFLEVEIIFLKRSWLCLFHFIIKKFKYGRIKVKSLMNYENHFFFVFSVLVYLYYLVSPSSAYFNSRYLSIDSKDLSSP